MIANSLKFIIAALVCMHILNAAPQSGGYPNPPKNCECFATDAIFFIGGEDNKLPTVIVPHNSNKGKSKAFFELKKSGSSSSECSNVEAKIEVYRYPNDPDKITILVDYEELDSEIFEAEVKENEGPYTVELFVKRDNGVWGGCQKKKFDFGGCSACSGSCKSKPSTTSEDSINTRIMVGSTYQGDVSLPMMYQSKEVQNPGVEALDMMQGSGYVINRNTNGEITSVTSDNVEALVSSVTSNDDPKAFKIDLKHRSGGVSGSIFQTTTFENVGTGANMVLKITNVRDGNTYATEWKKIDDPTGEYYYHDVLTKDNGLIRETKKKKYSQDGSQTINRTTIEELKSDGTTYEIVSDIEETYTFTEKGERKTREVIDPDGAALVNIWEYYGYGEVTGPGGSTEGIGEISRSVRYDGYETTHTYTATDESTNSSYANDSQGQTVLVSRDLATDTTTTTRSVGSNIISKTVEIRGTNLTTTRTYTDASNYLETVTEYYPVGADFGGQVKKVTRPDNTVTIYDYQRSGGSKITTVYDGVPGGSNITDGTKTVSTVSEAGELQSRIVTAVGSGNGVVLGHQVVTSTDGYGRPLSIGYFPDGSNYAYTTSMTYSCCGVESETDMYGVTTYYAYDDLERVIKSNRLGVTTETVHDGRTTSTHRYTEAPTGSSLPNTSYASAANMVSKSVNNLAGTISESWSRSAKDGTLVKANTTTISYLNPEGSTPATLPTGIGKKIVQEPIMTASESTQPSQTTEFYFDGKTYQTYGDLSPAMRYSYAVNTTGPVTTRSYVDGANLRETTTNTSDWAGRNVRMDYMDGAYAATEYNSLGQMVKSTDLDGVVTLMAYNSRGESVIQAVDLNDNGDIDYGTDNITSSESLPYDDGTDEWIRTITKVWQDGDTNSSAGTVVSTNLRSTDGLTSSSQSIGVANASTSVTTLSGGGDWTVKTTNPDNTYSLATYIDGLMDRNEIYKSDDTLISSSSIRDSSNTALSGYDSLNRPTHRKDSRTGITTTSYLSATADVVASITDSGGLTTAFVYDVRGRQVEVDAEDTAIAGGTSDNITTTDYFPDGKVKEKDGDQTYKVTYTYDYADRMATMTTYGTTTAVTTWIYDTQRGWLIEKNYNGETDDGSTDADYTYTSAGRLYTRTWERGVTTTYGYDDGGRMVSTDYSDSTPDISMSYDALNRPTSQSNGIATTTYSYSSTTLALDTETISYDWNVDQTADLVRVIDRSQDTLQRPSGYVLEDTSTTPVVDTQVTYTYGSTDGRLATVSDGTDTFTYAYTANSNLIATVAGPQHTVTNTWESDRNVLGLKENEAGATLISSYDYTVNDIGQRGSVDVAGSAYSGGQRDRSWTYDARGQLVAEDDANDNTLDRGFAFDGIGNRTASIDGNTDTTQSGNVFYTPNSLNQYEFVGSFEPTYDLDGNTEDTQIRAGGLGTTTLSDATYKWDGENRLVKILDGSSNTIAEYVYDSQSRRVRRTVNGGADIAYVYDGWNPIAEYDLSSTPALLLVNLWGVDLSGSAQGAGGVGGLLSVSTSSDTYYPTYDGNGNVSQYLDDTGAIAAHYEYDAFGNVVNYTESAAGVASTFRHRFSTKQQDDESGLLYYGYRYYDPVTGRWPSRDPIEEEGGVNLYEFVRNSAVNGLDYLGLKLELYRFGSADVINVSKAQMSARTKDAAAGITEEEWNSRIECNDCTLSIKGELLIRIYILHGWSNKIGPDGMLIINHEREHEKLFGNAWNQYANLINEFDGYVFRNNEDCEEWNNWLRSMDIVWWRTAQVENSGFDIQQYGGDPIRHARSIQRADNSFEDWRNIGPPFSSPIKTK